MKVFKSNYSTSNRQCYLLATAFPIAGWEGVRVTLTAKLLYNKISLHMPGYVCDKTLDKTNSFSNLRKL